jgi:DNA-binding response OmpR family regulator
MDPMDGPTFLRALRQRPDTADVPVIMVTTSDADDSGDLARELRISAWLTKPISAARLTERVRAVLGVQMHTAPTGSPDWSALTERYQAKLSAEVVTM